MTSDQLTRTMIDEMRKYFLKNEDKDELNEFVRNKFKNINSELSKAKSAFDHLNYYGSFLDKEEYDNKRKEMATALYDIMDLASDILKNYISGIGFND